jgi:hypothetical protein
MLFLRLLGRTLVFAAFLALTYDGVRMLASPGEGLLLTSLSTHLQRVPGASETLRSFILAHGPDYFWDGILEPVLVLPVSLLLGALGAVTFLAGYRAPPPEISGD